MEIGGAGGAGAAYVRVSAVGKAENCGEVNIYNSLTIYAYGGGGGSGGPGSLTVGGRDGSSGSAGGYPAAGIGRWRSRRRWWKLLLWWRWL